MVVVVMIFEVDDGVLQWPMGVGEGEEREKREGEKVVVSVLEKIDPQFVFNDKIAPL